MLNAQALNKKEVSIVTISAFTALGDTHALKTCFEDGLNKGLSVNEIKEILIQLAAYCGFPRSLNAINTFAAVINERKAKGITDPEGIAPSTISGTDDKYSIGKRNLEQLTGKAESAAPKGYAAFVPVIDTFLKEHLFADIFSRGVLSYRERELITVSALTSLGGVEAQLQGHLSICLYQGFTAEQLRAMFSVIEHIAGKKKADDGRKVLSRLLAARAETNN